MKNLFANYPKFLRHADKTGAVFYMTAIFASAIFSSAILAMLWLAWVLHGNVKFYQIFTLPIVYPLPAHLMHLGAYLHWYFNHNKGDL